MLAHHFNRNERSISTPHLADLISFVMVASGITSHLCASTGWIVYVL